MKRIRRVISVLVAGLTMVGSAEAIAEKPATDDVLLQGHRGDTSAWPMYGGDFHQQRYTELDQINRGNVKKLKPAWTFHTGERVWGFQYVPHDEWDYDGGCPPVLFDIEIEGKQYIAISAGGSCYVRRDRKNPPEADAIIAFALP